MERNRYEGRIEGAEKPRTFSERLEDALDRAQAFEKGEKGELDEHLCESEESQKIRQQIADFLEKIDKEEEEWERKPAQESDVSSQSSLENELDEEHDKIKLRNQNVKNRSFLEEVTENPHVTLEQNENEIEETGQEITNESQNPSQMVASQREGFRSKEQFDQALEHYPELRMEKGFDGAYQSAENYFEREALDGEEFVDTAESTKPDFVSHVEQLELRRMYENTNGGPPEVPIESMEDVDELLEKYPDNSEIASFEERYRRCGIYFEVKDDWSKTRDELAEIHDVGHGFVGYCRNGIEPLLIAKLREQEESSIIQEWAEENETWETLAQNPASELDVAYRSTIEGISELNYNHRIDSEAVHEAFGNLEESESWDSQGLATRIQELQKCLPEAKTGIYYAELRTESGLDSEVATRLEKEIKANHDEIRQILEQELDDSGVNRIIRIAALDGRLYLWSCESDPKNFGNVYSDQYYYFREKKDMVELVDRARERLEISENLYESMTHVNELMQQFLSGDSEGTSKVPAKTTAKSHRWEGRVLQFHLDVAGVSLKDMEGRFEKIAGINGQAGIYNPRFPEGEKLDMLRARLAATIISDGHLRESGRITYNEKDTDRIERVKEILSHFGDIELNGYHRDGLYEIHIPCQIGLALIRWGMKPGDKTILNPGLPESIVKGSEKAKRAYLEELIPEDGYFKSGKGFAWSRNHVLHAGDKTESYQFEPKIAQNVMHRLMQYGQTDEGLVKQTTLVFGDLKRLREHNDQEVAKAADRMVRAVLQNPNRLLEDEKQIAESLGIQVTASPICVKHYTKSNRISVKWVASTFTKEDAIRWAETCPPNDTKKRDVVEKWLREIAEEWLDKPSNWDHL